MGKIKKTIAFLIALLPLFSLTVNPVFASATYSYDANGNLTSDGVNCYTYDDANQVSQVKNCVSNQTVAQYVYDYQGNRIVKKNYVGGSFNNTVYSPNDGYETKKLANNSTQNTTYYFVNDDLVAKKIPMEPRTITSRIIWVRQVSWPVKAGASLRAQPIIHSVLFGRAERKVNTFIQDRRAIRSQG